MTPAIRRIVVATDFSDLADHALGRALSLAAQLGASITLVHAYELPILSLPDGFVMATAEMMASIVTVAQSRLDKMAARLESRGVPIKTVLRNGAAWEEINAAAVVEGADLIVMGTHGRRGLSRAMMGSVAERVIRTATLPVLIVPHEKPEAG